MRGEGERPEMWAKYLLWEACRVDLRFAELAWMDIIGGWCLGDRLEILRITKWIESNDTWVVAKVVEKR